MKKGDLSNRTSPIIVFDLDNLLFKENKINEGFIGKIAKTLSGDPYYEYFNREVNYNFIYICNSIWLNYGFTILLETSFPYYKTTSLFDFLNEKIMLYYSNLLDISLPILRLRLDLDFKLYVSTNYDKLNEINKSNAIHISELPNYIMKLRK